VTELSGVRRWVLRLITVVALALFATILLSVLPMVLVKSSISPPNIVDCWSGNVMTLGPIESTRKHGRIVKREFLGCDWYWHVSTRDGS
jgi:hypothetical protein